MVRQRGGPLVDVRAIIQQPSGACLIVRRRPDPARPWHFPGALISPNSDPVELLRRTCLLALGVHLRVMTPQPTLTYGLYGAVVAYRHFLCPVPGDEALPLAYAELRWVVPARMPGYPLDTPTWHFVQRLVSSSDQPTERDWEDAC